VRFAEATKESITGTSMSTPTTVASAALDDRPKRPMATATASKKVGRADHRGGSGDAEREPFSFADLVRWSGYKT